MPVDIPTGLTNQHYYDIEKFLRQFLQDLRGLGAMRVTSRLNWSKSDSAKPVWVGAVEEPWVVDSRERNTHLKIANLGRYRFGQTNKSKVYEDAINEPSGDIVSRDWYAVTTEKLWPNGPAQGYGPAGNCKCQWFIAIRIQVSGSMKLYRHVGTLTAGFDTDPGNNSAVKQIMENWAHADCQVQNPQEQSSRFITFIKTVFDLGGPVV